MTDLRQVNVSEVSKVLGAIDLIPSVSHLPRAKVFGSISITRIMDVVIAIALLIFIAPLMMIIALAILVTDPGPIVFAHRRVGRNGVMFPCLKFRSMAMDSQERLVKLLESDPAARIEWERDHKLRNDPRITPIGHFLRKSSLDEVLQLINVLRGEMSLVGPRPITPEEGWRYGHRINTYCRVRPGITGLWQVSGRNETTYRRRVALDVVFVRHHSPSLYLAILVRTVPAVLLARGSC